MRQKNIEIAAEKGSFLCFLWAFLCFIAECLLSWGFYGVLYISKDRPGGRSDQKVDTRFHATTLPSKESLANVSLISSMREFTSDVFGAYNTVALKARSPKLKVIGIGGQVNGFS